MGKGGKKNQQPEKQQQSEKEPSQEVDEEFEDQYDEEGISQLDPEFSDQDEKLLERINQEIEKSEQPLKLTWAAIYKLKEEEKQLNQRMDQQIKKIQEKFYLLKAPLFHKMAKVASGQPIEKQIYTKHELTKSLSVNKNKPQAIPDFWKKAVQGVGFPQCEEDAQILENCKHFQVDSQNAKNDEKETYKIKVVFDIGDNEFVTNKQLKIEVEKINDQFKIHEITPIKTKKPIPQESGFAQLFNPQTSQDNLFQICQSLQTAYNNAVFYYFYRINPQAIEDEEGGQDEQESEQDGQNGQEDSEQQIKPVKKKGTQNKKIQRKQAPIQKPECQKQ